MKNHLKYGNQPEKEKNRNSAMQTLESGPIRMILFATSKIECSFA